MSVFGGETVRGARVKRRRVWRWWSGGGGLRVARRAKLSADKGDHAENDSKVRPLLSPDTRREQALSIPHPDVDLKDQTV